MTPADGGHPSHLALDRAALGTAPPEIMAHVAACPVCRERAAPPSTAGQAPAWLRRLGPRRAPSFLERAWLGVGSRGGLGLGVAAIACVMLVGALGGRGVERTPTGSYLGTKGAPEVWLYVKRGERVEVWNGSAPIAPGDLLRLTVAPDRFAHVSVFEATKTAAAYERLYEGPLVSRRATALPVSWRVDDRSADETLIVVMGPDAVAASRVAEVLSSGAGGRYWWRRLVLVKAAAP